MTIEHLSTNAETPREREIASDLASCIETLLLSDHMGDAHEAGLRLVKMLMGKEGVDKYMAYVDGNIDAFRGNSWFEIIGREK